MKKIIIFIAVFFLLGCSNYYTDINNLAIINEIAIDYDSDYKVYVKVLKSDKESEIFIENGKTLDDCFSSLNNKLTKKLYLAHLDLLVLSDNLDKENYKDIIEFFLSLESSRNTFDTIITNKIAEDFLKIDSKEIQNLLDLSINSNGLAKNKSFDGIIKDILNYRLSYIPYIDSEHKEVLGLKSIFEENKLLDKDSSITVNFSYNLIDNITLLIDDKSYKLESCSSTNLIDENKITLKVSCNYKGSSEDKEIIKTYLSDAFYKHIKENSNNYFFYLQDKYGKKGHLELLYDLDISLMKESSGDYFV